MCFRESVLALLLTLCYLSVSQNRIGSADAFAQSPQTPPAPKTAARSAVSDPPPRKIVPVHKSDAEWRRQLTSRQFAVTRRKETEPAYHNKYWRNKRTGEYRCACCELELFSSQAKFDSGTGWPSFSQPVDSEHLAYDEDRSELPVRTEVKCARCEAHLGHLFSDGPAPTGWRYCMNSAAMEFVEAEKPPKKAGPASTAKNR